MTTIPFRMAMVIPGGIDKMELKNENFTAMYFGL